MTTEQPDQVSMREALELMLSDKAANEPGFLEAAMLDPRGTVQSLAAQLMVDDGDLDLSEANVNIHIQTPDSIHLVLSASPAEVSGFIARRSFELFPRIKVTRPRVGIGIGGATVDCSGCDSTCNTQTYATAHCAGGDCKSSAAL